MADRKRISPAELSAIRSEAGRKGGLARTGTGKRIPRVQISAYKQDHEVLTAYARSCDMTLALALHHLARVILQNHPDIAKPDGWLETI